MKRLALCAALTALAGPAFAADPVVYEPAPAVAPVAAAYDWTGFYVGLQAGYLWGASKADYSSTGFPGVHSPIDPEGFFGGAYLGYNYQFDGGIVAGVEGDINYGSIEGSSPLLDAGGVPIAGQSFEGEIDWFGSVRARLGYAHGRFLPFVTGGLAIAHYDVGNTVAGTTEHALDETLAGWTVGAGAEYAFTDNLIGRLEYRYADYGDTRAGTVVLDDYDVDLSTHDVRVGVGYKF